MATQFIDKDYGANSTTAIADDTTGRAKVRNLPDAAGIKYDIVDNTLKFNANGSIRTIQDSSGTGFTTTNIGTVAGATISAVEYGNGIYHRTVLTLTAFPLSIADTGAFGTGNLYTFPEGVVTFLGGFYNLAETTTSTLASTLNASAVLSTGVGTTATADNTVSGAEANIVAATNVTASATINVAGTAVVGVAPAPTTVNGSASALIARLNVGVTDDTQIDGDATSTWSGTVTFDWVFSGDV